MRNTIYPCLWFDNQAAEAAAFYCSLFPNSQIIGNAPVVVQFELNGAKFMGLNGGPQFKMNQSISISALCETIEETDALWEMLSYGGSVMIPIDEYDWSKRYGWLQDRFGLTWQISVVHQPGDKAKLTPSLLFTNDNFGKAAEAISVYTKIFPNSATKNLVYYPANDLYAGKVMFAEFTLDGNDFTIMDGPGNHQFQFNEAISLFVNCNNQQEIDHYWNSLIARGGQEGRCGWLKDKFGVSWQIIPSNLGELMSNPAKGKKPMELFMGMHKIDIAALENA